MSLPEAQEKAAVVEAMFDRIARRYDLMNRLMTFGFDRTWRRHTIDEINPSPGDLVVDLACGTGDLARDAVLRGARVIGVDFSAGMLAGAQARGVDAELVRGDAAALPLASASCDGLVSGFALRNFVDIGAAIDEAARVLKPGARMALLEVDTPRSALLRWGHAVHFNKVVPLLGRLLSDGEAYSYLPSSVVYLPPEREMLDMLAGAGFVSVRKRRLMAGAIQLLSATRAAKTVVSVGEGASAVVSSSGGAPAAASELTGVATDTAADSGEPSVGASADLSHEPAAPRIERSVVSLSADLDVLERVHAAGVDPLFYWESPGEDLAIGAAGAVCEIRGSGDRRFASATEQCRRIIDVVGEVSGEGRAEAAAMFPDAELPLFVGGFAFADEQSADSRWHEFPPLRLFVPRLLWIKRAGCCAAVLAWKQGERAESQELFDRVAAVHPPAGLGACDAAVVGVDDCEDRSRWRNRFGQVAALIEQGDASKVVLARGRRLTLSHAMAPAVILDRLRASRPMCSSFWLSAGGSHLLGSSPEMLVRVAGRELQADAVAGTAARGACDADDRRNAAALAASDKDLREHALVVEAMVTALSGLGESLDEASQPEVLSLPEAHHLRTPLRVRLGGKLSVLEAASLLHPTPAVCGVPTDAVRDLLLRDEPWRGWYTGAVGWMSAGGAGEFTVALRSALLRETEAWVWAGAGIVRDSDADAEFDETEGKLKAMLPVLGGGLGERAA